MNRLVVAAALVCTSLLAALPSQAQDETARFALVIGANDSIDEDLPTLSYADDDAARYYDFFNSIGVRTRLIASLDDSTSRLHPDAAKVALPAIGTSFDAQLAALVHDVKRARADDRFVEVYFVFAGHGNHKDGKGYLTLEDRRIRGRDLFGDVVTQINADRTHLIVDACYSFLLTQDRGPGGRRKAAQGFANLNHLSQNGVGLILSTSSAARSHEWQGFQAGVFSHEVRSGLYGAADVDGDGRVSYRELASFVQSANRSVKNEKFKPKIFVRPPNDDNVLLDLKLDTPPTLLLDGQVAGHYLLEDADGIRYFDVHNSRRQTLRLVRPQKSPLFLRRMKDASTADDIEYVIKDQAPTVRVAQLDVSKPEGQSRGAEHHAFSSLFDRPHSEEQLDRFSISDVTLPDDGGGLSWKVAVGGTSLGVATALVLTGVGAFATGALLISGVPASATGAQAEEANTLATVAEVSTAALVGTGLVVGVAGAGLIAWEFVGDEE